MTVAIPVVKNKYWIVEADDGQKVATIQAADDGVILVQGDLRHKYPSIKILELEHNIKFSKTKTQAPVRVNSVYDYPSSSRPYNAIYDIKNKLPLYTTSKKSKSYRCAGYYLIQLGSLWVTDFCPKRIILTRNPYLGPFRTSQQMLDQFDKLAQV